MRKLDKAKANKVIAVLGTILALACFAAGIITQLDTQDTTQALCWIIAGSLAGAIKVEVN